MVMTRINGFQKSNADRTYPVFIKKGDKRKPTVLFGYSVYNSKFKSQIMILVRSDKSRIAKDSIQPGTVPAATL